MTSSRSRETASESSSDRPGRFAQPEWNGRRLPLRVVYAYPAGLDPQDPVRRIAELEDVARKALDGEILVDGADELIRGLEHDVVVGGVGNRAARRDRREPGAAPAAQDSVHRITMNVRRAMASPRAEPLGDHAHDGEILVARQCRVGPGAE